MKPRNSRLFAPLGILLFLLLCMVPNSQGQTQLSYSAGGPFQLGIGFSFNSASGQTNAFNVGGLQYYTVVWMPSGTVSACTLTVDGAPIAGGTFTTGSMVASQNCASAGSFTTPSATQAYQAKLTPTITGSGTLSVFVFGYVTNPSGANVTNTVTVTPTAIVTSGIAIANSSQAALTTAVVVKASQGNLFGFWVTNGAASTCYLEFINASSSPVLGTNAVFSIPVPATGAAPVIVTPGTYALNNFATGISVGMATTYNGSTACGTAGIAVIFYK